MKHEHQTGVYKLHKLARIEGNKFDTDIKRLERDSHVIHHDYADKINAESQNNGLLYEHEPAKTKLYWEGKPFKAVKEYAEFETVSENVSEEVSETKKTTKK
jgi:hypothetical protein